MENENNKIKFTSDEDKYRIKEDINEVHRNLQSQVKYYKRRANIALSLIVGVTVVGCMTFGLTNFLVRNDYESSINKIIQTEQDELQLKKEHEFRFKVENDLLLKLDSLMSLKNRS